jgi:hypothetical protein
MGPPAAAQMKVDLSSTSSLTRAMSSGYRVPRASVGARDVRQEKWQCSRRVDGRRRGDGGPLTSIRAGPADRGYASQTAWCVIVAVRDRVWSERDVCGRGLSYAADRGLEVISGLAYRRQVGCLLDECGGSMPDPPDAQQVLEALALTGARTVVAAMATGAWQATRTGTARLFLSPRPWALGRRGSAGR